MIAKLPGAAFGDADHVIFGAKMQASSRTRLDARGLQPFTHAIGAERALKHLLSSGIEFRNIERTSTDAVAAANAVLLLKIDDAIRVLDDGAVCRASAQTSRIGAVHALMFAHQQQHAAVVALVLIDRKSVV